MTEASPTLVEASHLVGIGDIAEQYGVSRAAVCNWRTRYPNFPAPVQTLRSGPIFLRPAVDLWHSNRARPTAATPT